MAEPPKLESLASVTTKPEPEAVLPYRRPIDPTNGFGVGRVLSGFLFGGYFCIVCALVGIFFLANMNTDWVSGYDLSMLAWSIILMGFVMPFATLITLMTTEIRRIIMTYGAYNRFYMAVILGVGYVAGTLIAVLSHPYFPFNSGIWEITSVLWLLLAPIAAGFVLYKRIRPEYRQPLE